MAKSDLPFSGQFTPNQVDLPQLLQIIHEYSGSRIDIQQAIGDRFFVQKDGKNGLAENTFLALRAYKLLTDDESHPMPTALADKLLELISNENTLYAHFAKHILLNLHGYDLVQVVQDMQSG